MYGKMKPAAKKKPMPAGLLASFKAAKPLPKRGQRTATNTKSRMK